MSVEQLKGACAKCFCLRPPVCAMWLSNMLLMVVLVFTVQADAEKSTTDLGAPISSPQAVTSYTNAANFQNNGEFELAADEWTKFLAKFDHDPLAAPARYHLGVCKMQVADYQEAARWFQAAIDSQDDVFTSIDESHLNLGWCLYLLGIDGDQEALRKAAETLTELIKQHPETGLADQAFFCIGECAYHLGQLKIAVKAHQTLITDYPDSELRPDALYAEIVTLQELGEHAAVGPFSELFLNDYSEHPLRDEIRMRKAESLLQQGEISVAEKLFAQLADIKNFPSIDHVIFRQAYCAASQKKFVEAVELYEQIIEKFSESSYSLDAQLGVGRCYSQLGEWERAIGSLEQVTKVQDLRAGEAAHWLSRAYLKQDRPALSLQAAEAEIARAQDSPFLLDLKLDRAEALFASDGRKQEAMQAFVDISQQFPNDPRAATALYNAALTALELEEYGKAHQYSGQLIEQFADDPLVTDAKYIRAESQLLVGAHAEAVELFAKLLETCSGHPEAANWRLRCALALFLQKEYQPAIDLLSEHIDELEVAEQRAHALYLIGTSHSHMGRDQQAVDLLQKSFQVAPQWSQGDKVLLNLARAQRRQGKAVAAVATLAQFTLQFTDSPYVDRAKYQLGELAFDQEQYSLAISYYRKMLREHAQSDLVPEALYGLGWSQLRAKDYPVAVMTLTKLIDEHGQHRLVSEARQARAICRQNMGDFQGVVDDVEQLLKASPAGDDLAVALYYHGLAAIQLNQVAKAIESFTRIVEEVKDYDGMLEIIYELAWAHHMSGNMEQALVWFERIAVDFPESRMVAEAAFHLGEGAYTSKKYPVAATWFRQSASRADDAVLSEKAVYKLGWSEYQQKRHEPSLLAFNRLLKHHPDGELAGKSQFMSAECLFRMERFEEALVAYDQFLRVPQNSQDMAVLTLLHGGQSASRLKEWTRAIEWLHQIQEKHPQSKHADLARYEEGWAHQNQNHVEQARKLYSEVAESSRNVVGARARFMLGELMFSEKDYQAATAEFKRVMYGYGGDTAPQDVQTWQAKAGLEAGRCTTALAGKTSRREQKNHYLQQATKHFRYVTDHHAETQEAVVAANQLKRIGS